MRVKANACIDCGGDISPKATRCTPCATAHLHPHIDRTPKPLSGERRHGTYVAYVIAHCRCIPCSHASREYERNRIRTHAYGRWGEKWVDDLTPVREHIATLRDFGIGLKRLAVLSGVSHGALTKLVYGQKCGRTHRVPSRRILRTTADAILSVEPTLDNLPDVAKVPTHGATRRVQALVALGWSQSKLAVQLGVLPGNFTSLVHGRTDTTAKRHRAVVALYDRLSMTLPPEGNQRDRIAASRARRYAREHDWLPPLALDDDQLDDPDYQPTVTRRCGDGGLDEAAIFRRMGGDKSVRLTKAEAAEVVHRWAASGRSLAECEHATGINPHRHRRRTERSGHSTTTRTTPEGKP